MFKKFLPKSEFGKNIVTLTSGSTVSQLIPLLVTPILSRLYAAEDFGVFAVYLSVALIFAVVATGRYELAILLPEKKSEAVNVLAFSVFIVLCWVILTAILLPLFDEQIGIWSGNHPVMEWIYLLPISILLMGMNQSFGYWFNRNKQYKKLSAVRIAQSTTTAGSKLAISVSMTSPFGLIAGNILGFIVAVGVFFREFLRKEKEVLASISWNGMMTQAKRYSKFPKYDMGSGLLYTFSTQVPILLLASFFNAAVVGWYSVAHTVLKMPMSFIGSSIGQVFFQHSSTIKSDKTLFAATTYSMYKRLFWMGIFPMALVGGFGDVIFGFVLGKEWTEAGVYARFLSPWLLFVFLSSPISHILNVLEKQQLNLVFNFFAVVLRVLALLIGGLYFKDALLTVILFGAVSLIAWMTLTILVLKLANVNLSKFFWFTFPKIVMAFGLALGLRYLLF